MSYEHVDQPAEGRGIQAPSIKLVGLLVVAVLTAIFFFQNGDTVDIEILWMEVSWPERTVILISLVLGALLGQLGSFVWRRARRKKAAEKLT